MADSGTESPGCCKRCTESCCCCFRSSCCPCVPNCPCSCKSYCSGIASWFKRHFTAFIFLVFGWAGIIAAFILIEDPDWNIAIVPYLCAVVASALVSILCKRGHYDGERLASVCRPQIVRRSTENPGFAELLDSESSPLLPIRLSNVGTENSFVPSEFSPIAPDFEDLFEPTPGIFRDQREAQLTVQADVHQCVQEPTSPKTVSPELLGECSSTASVSDPQNSLTSRDSGVALQSTAQSTFSGTAGFVPRPPPPEHEQLETIPESPLSPAEKTTRF